ncbi:unnamed protein product [Brugia timori]|uniref:Bm13422 n=2 Tax=Brugia TaxID=6278 RepID=A0A1I9G1B0_BRUMA|nr:Bm13422 [Brugia malayi]VDO09833.1 unnamed protein product [Brugia timori]
MIFGHSYFPHAVLHHNHKETHRFSVQNHIVPCSNSPNLRTVSVCRRVRVKLSNRFTGTIGCKPSKLSQIISYLN